MDYMQRIEELNKKISREKEKLSGSLISEIMTLSMADESDVTSEAEDRHEDRESYDLKITSLYLLKISCEFDSEVSNSKRRGLDLKNDFDELFRYLGSYLIVHRLSDAYIYAIIKMIAVISECDHQLVRKYLREVFDIGVDSEYDLSEIAYTIFLIARTMVYDINEFGASVKVIDFLCSSLNKSSVEDVFVTIVTHSIALLSGFDNNHAVILGDKYYNHMCGVCNEYVGDFFWYYGSALEVFEEKEKAFDAFDRSFFIRRRIYGDDNWFTALSSRERAVVGLFLTKDRKWKSDLFDFVDKCEGGLFSDVDEDVLGLIEGKTLYPALSGFTDNDYIPGYEHYLDIYDRICREFGDNDEPVIQRRLSAYLRGGFYIRNGQFMMAEKYILQALSLPCPEETGEITVSESQIRSTLLSIYYSQGNYEEAFSLLDELFNEIDKGEDSGLSYRDIYRIYSMYLEMMIMTMSDTDQDTAEWLKEELSILSDSFYDQQFGEGLRELTVFVSASISYLTGNKYVSDVELSGYEGLLRKIESREDFSGLDEALKGVVYDRLLHIGLFLNRDYVKEYVDIITNNYIDSDRVPLFVRKEFLRIVSFYYYSKGDYARVRTYTERLLNEVTEEWHYYLRYLNDERLIYSLNSCQLLFNSFYIIIRSYCDLFSCYEKVINYKQLASIAGRERNRIIREYEVDQEIVAKLKGMQDQIAVADSSSVFRDESLISKLREEARNLEYEFADVFPDEVSYKTISLHEVQRRIPVGSAVIEYVCYEKYENIDFLRNIDSPVENGEDASGKIDIYVTVNDNGQIKIYRESVDESDIIIKKVLQFVNIMMSGDKKTADIEQQDDKKDIRAFLSDKLIMPFIPYINKIDTLYIAPDSMMINLPFELLNIREKHLGDDYNIIRIECIRDFLFFGDVKNRSGKSLVIGDPKYDLNEEEVGAEGFEGVDKNRGINPQRGSIKRLIYSGFEADIVGGYLSQKAAKENIATKSLLLNAQNYKNIHIATHGFFDMESESGSLYSSGLFFSGIINWIESGKISKKYGNGIVTADELSRKDFRDTELVVLSSCLSGMNELLWTKGLQGLVGAFSAAGVKYVVSHLWKANDFTTVVFMEKFYYYYTVERKEPPVALAYAKEYMKKLTVGEFRKTEFFRDISRTRSLEPFGDIYDSYMKMDERVKPFRNEAYWGGFSCYRCN